MQLFFRISDIGQVNCFYALVNYTPLSWRVHRMRPGDAVLVFYITPNQTLPAIVDYELTGI